MAPKCTSLSDAAGATWVQCPLHCIYGNCTMLVVLTQSNQPPPARPALHHRLWLAPASHSNEHSRFTNAPMAQRNLKTLEQSWTCILHYTTWISFQSDYVTMSPPSRWGTYQLKGCPLECALAGFEAVSTRHFEFCGRNAPLSFELSRTLRTFSNPALVTYMSLRGEQNEQTKLWTVQNDPRYSKNFQDVSEACPLWSFRLACGGRNRRTHALQWPSLALFCHSGPQNHQTASRTTTTQLPSQPCPPATCCGHQGRTPSDPHECLALHRSAAEHSSDWCLWCRRLAISRPEAFLVPGRNTLIQYLNLNLNHSFTKL